MLLLVSVECAISAYLKVIHLKPLQHSGVSVHLRIHSQHHAISGSHHQALLNKDNMILKQVY